MVMPLLAIYVQESAS